MGQRESRVSHVDTSLFDSSELAAVNAAFSSFADASGGRCIGKESFRASLAIPECLHDFSDRLHHSFSLFDSPCSVDGGVSKDALVSGLTRAVKRSSSSQLTFFYSLYDVEYDEKDPATVRNAKKECVRNMLNDASLLAMVNGGIELKSDAPCASSVVDCMICSMFPKGSVEIPLSKCLEWLMDNTPHLLTSSLEGLLCRIFLGQVKTSGGDGSSDSIMSSHWQFPLLGRTKRDDHLLLDSSSLWALSLALSCNVSKWKLLYSTSHHGRILNRFKHHTFGYDGPTVTVIRDCDHHVFGAFVEGGWTDTPKYCGTSNTFLFSLKPTFSIYRACGSERNYVYLYSDESKKSFPHGIGFGGSIGGFRLFVDADLKMGESRSADATFSRGGLAGEALFEVDSIEVWGIGGTRADEAQSYQRERQEKFTQGRRKVNRRMMAGESLLGDDNPDKWMLDMVGITGHSNAYKDDLRRGDEDEEADD